MNIHDDERFIKRVESLIDPDEVGDLSFIQKFRRLMPKSLFRKLLSRASKKFPYIGFVIEPYSLFLFLRLKDFERARALLPKRYELVKSRISADDAPDYFHGMGISNTRGSTFGGTRLESYLIARDKETGLVSWIFLDIFSNTIIALPRHGVADRNSGKALYTTNSRGDVFVDITEDGTGRRLHLRGNINRGAKKPIDQPLWIGGNTSIAYTERLSGGVEEPFAVIFDPAEVETALEIPVEDIQLRENTLMPGLAEEGLAKVLCFPFAQHYMADGPGCRTYVRDEEDMIARYNELAGRISYLIPISHRHGQFDLFRIVPRHDAMLRPAISSASKFGPKSVMPASSNPLTVIDAASFAYPLPCIPESQDSVPGSFRDDHARDSINPFRYGTVF